MALRVLYVDTLFFINFALDLLSLTLVGILLHIRRRLWRLLVASALGAVYAVAAVLFGVPPFLHFLLSLGMSFVLVMTAFRNFGNKGRFLAAIIAFYLASVLLGGVIDALFGVLEGFLPMRFDGALRLSDLVLLFGFAAFGLVYAASRFFGGMPLGKFAYVRITFGMKSVTFSVLIDSGCLINDPISGKPALVVRAEALSSVLPREILACARSKHAFMPRDPDTARKCRLIPAEALGERRLLLSVRPDRLCVLPDKNNRKTREKEKELDAYVALLTTEENHFGGFEGVLPSSLLLLQ